MLAYEKELEIYYQLFIDDFIITNLPIEFQKMAKVKSNVPITTCIVGVFLTDETVK